MGNFVFDRLKNTAGNKGFAIAGVPCFADTFIRAIIDFKRNS